MNTQLLLILLSICYTTHYLEAMMGAKVESATRSKPLTRSTSSSIPQLSSMKSWFSTTWTKENKVAVANNNGETVESFTRNSKSILKKSAPIKPQAINIDLPQESDISPSLSTDDTISSKDALKNKQISFDETVQINQKPFEQMLKSMPQSGFSDIQEPQGTFETHVEFPRPGLKITEFYNKNNLLIGRITQCNNPKRYPKDTTIIIEERLDGSVTCQILYPDSTVIMQYKNDSLVSINYQNPAEFPLHTTINVSKNSPMSLTATMIEPGTQESPQSLKIEYTIKYNAASKPISVNIKEISRDQTDKISFNFNKKGDLQMYKNSTQDTHLEQSFAEHRKDQLGLYLEKFNKIMKEQPSMPII